MQPLETLLPALYAVLSTPPLVVVNGEAMPVFEHLPNGFSAPRYVLMGQPTANRAGGSRGCKLWNCTVLLDCVTLFTPGFVSSAPADALASAVVDRLDDQRLPLEGGYGMSPARVETVQGIDDALDGEQIDVHRYVRMRFLLEYHTGTAAVELEGFDYSFPFALS